MKPLSDRYLKRKPIFNLFLYAIDVFLAIAALFHKKAANERLNTKRILLANGAHLGDVVISTSVIPILKSAYPDAQIGFLCGSWSRIVLDGNPNINFIHTVDHWRLNRAANNILQKIIHYWRTRKCAIDEIRKLEYDVAIDLYTCFPNSIPLLWQSKIPFRIGFISSGFGPLLTHGIRFPIERSLHESAYQASLLHLLKIDPKHFNNQHAILSRFDDRHVHEVKQLIAESGATSVENFIVLHIGTGLPAKEWPIQYWRELTTMLSQQGNRLLFTGVGSREHHLIETVIAGLDYCTNACDKLSWKAFLAAIQHAQVVICSDSLAGHLAAALETKSIVIYSGITDQKRWRPQSKHSVIMQHPVPCAPCNKKSGCLDMTCIRGIKPNDVYLQIVRSINAISNQ